QGGDQPHQQQHGEHRPGLADVVTVEAQDAGGRGSVGGGLEGVDQGFEKTEQHCGLLPMERRRAVGPAAGWGYRRLASTISTGSRGSFWCMPRLPVGTWAIWSTTSMPRTTLPNTA